MSSLCNAADCSHNCCHNNACGNAMECSNATLIIALSLTAFFVCLLFWVCFCIFRHVKQKKRSRINAIQEQSKDATRKDILDEDIDNEPEDLDFNEKDFRGSKYDKKKKLEKKKTDIFRMSQL